MGCEMCLQGVILGFVSFVFVWHVGDFFDGWGKKACRESLSSVAC